VVDLGRVGLLGATGQQPEGRLVTGRHEAGVSGLQTALARYGYQVPTHGKFDGATMEVVTAFQRHFRPARVDGVADHSTTSTLHALLSSLPADATPTAVAAK
jgi:N-acetylmuramoyl-L-alanine amidase